MKNSAPDHLSTESQAWHSRLVSEYGITDDGGLLLLQTAMEAFDRMRECQKAISKDGAQVKDRFEQLKPHPLLSVERDARSQLLAALKAMNLDLEPLKSAPGRPAGL